MLYPHCHTHIFHEPDGREETNFRKPNRIIKLYKFRLERQNVNKKKHTHTKSPMLEYIVNEVNDVIREKVNDKEREALRIAWTKDLTSSS